MPVPAELHTTSSSSRSQRRSMQLKTQVIEDYALLQPSRNFYDSGKQKISDDIDEEIKRDGQQRKEAKRKTVKVMLLGQSESGKSTLQKQFQLLYASKTLDSEKPLWTPIVHLNLVRAIRMILDELDYSFASPSDISTLDIGMELGDSKIVYRQLEELRAPLLSVVALEKNLAIELNGGFSVSGNTRAVFLRSGWQAVGQTRRPSTSSSSSTQMSVMKMTANTLFLVKEDIRRLWRHPAVELLVREGKLRLDESAPFFLDNIARLSAMDYIPSTEDILAVRLQTLGVVEHSFSIAMAGAIYDWKLYDVGGARGQRPAWIPYFDDAAAIIFLAPISAFDQFLEEDPRINRLNDSLQLFGQICENKLLQDAHLVLLLNKADVLHQKLEQNVQIKKYITSYGDRPNDYKNASQYFKTHFTQVHKKKDIGDRKLYLHFTTMINVKASQSIILNVGEAIIRQHVERAGLL